MDANRHETFDYVIVGSGAGGGTLAARLVERGFTVAVLEAGGDPRSNDEPDDPAQQQLRDHYDVPVFHAYCTENASLRWDFWVRHYGNTEQQARDKCCYKEEYGGVLYPRAGTLGGCTAHNAMITVYPHNADWDAIAEATSDPSWKAENMRKYFERLEDCRHRAPYRWLAKLGINPARHGWKGWLHTEKVLPREVLKDKALLDVIFQSTRVALEQPTSLLQRTRWFLQSQGDPNDWRLVKQSSVGIRYTPLATRRHQRMGTRERLLETAKRHPGRLRILLNALATRVLLDKDNKAVGVEYLEGEHLYHASPKASPARAGIPGQVRARQEVILCGGAFNTPQLLMLSGIGPAAELRKHGIEVRVDLPGVGQNLQDRYEVGVVNEMARPWAVLDGATFARGDPQYKEWEAERSGVYATNGAVLAVVKRSTEAKPLPDLFCFALLGKFHGYFPDYSSLISRDRNCLTWAILKAHTNNRAGEVTLRSSNPRETPAVNFKYFHEGTEDGGEDLDAVVEGIKFARAMTRELIDRGEVRRELIPGERVKSDEELRAFVRDHAWGHHASCTCAIGSVLDSQFSVRGTRGLRVVDASVFPRIPGFFIVTAIYMVAEKAADVIAAAATKGDLMDTKTDAPGDLAPGEGLALERARIEERRDWLKLRECHPSPDRAWGLALSGGGIRSATFSLGVLQGLASSRLRSDDTAQKRTLLHYFDYLSTVSGGGYIGAFFCSLFVPKRLQPDPSPPDKPIPMTEQVRSAIAAIKQLRLDMKLDEAASRAQKEALKKQPADPSVDAANRAYETIAYDPPTRFRAGDPYDTARTPTAWLRDNGRYLAPTGAGDLFYAGTLGLRNWLSLQFVIGTVLLLLFSLISFARAGLAEVSQPYALVEFIAMYGSLRGAAPVWGEIWWSPLLAVLVLLVPVLLAIGVAFWLAHWMPHQAKRTLPVFTFTTAVVVAAFLAGGLFALASRLDTLHRGTPVSTGLQATAGIIVLAIVLHLFGRRGRNVAEQRVATTRWLSTWLQVTLAAALIGIVDTAGQTLYRELTDPEAAIWMALSPAGLLAGLIWVVRHFAASAGEKKKDKVSIPLGWIAGAAGLLMLTLVATGWQLLVQWVQWHGAAPDPNAIVQMGRYGTLGWLTIAALVLAITVGKFASFINVSSLQSFYSARLVRAFLGASNGSRFTSVDAAQCSVAEPHENDELPHDKYYAPEVLAPLHIINVTVNQTLNRGEQLVQRDRKGKPLAILPHGFSLDGWHNRLRERRAWHEIQLPLSIGNWIGTSGAAFSTGIGRATSLSSSLALGLANVRLGTWWESGLGKKSSKAISRFGEMFFTSQTYLAYELLGQFHGTRRRWQYLSDGGHFENTALFELLRKDKGGDRGVQFMVCCDSGCDPKYQFNDLANLIRLARIDFRAEIEVDTKIAEHPQLGHRFGTVAEFSGDKAVATKCAILLKVRYAPVAPDAPAEKVIVLLKPRVIPGVPVDIGEYKATHEEFPQETTADQFFDEAQWEGYRKLGRAISEEIFGAEKCGPHLWTYLAQEHGIRVVNPVTPAPATAEASEPRR